MSATTPRVWTAAWGERAYLDGPGEQRVALDTAPWFAWLAAPTTTSFAYPVFEASCGYIVGVMTVRKEQRPRGGGYWWAYRRQDGRLRKVYVGATAALTQARLAAVAHSFTTDHPQPPPARPRSPGNGAAGADTTDAAEPREKVLGPPRQPALDVTASHPHIMDVEVPPPRTRRGRSWARWAGSPARRAPTRRTAAGA